MVDMKFKHLVSFQVRFETIRGVEGDRFLELMSQLNCILEFGIQTTNMNEMVVISRRNSLNHVAKVMERLNEREIHYIVSLIYGLPLQTLASFKESVQFLEDHHCPRIECNPLMLLTGTRLYEEKERYGLIEETSNGISYVVSSNTFSKEDYKKMATVAKEVETRNHLREGKFMKSKLLKKVLLISFVFLTIFMLTACDDEYDDNGSTTSNNSGYTYVEEDKTVSASGISISNTYLTIEVDQMYTLFASVAPANTTNKNITWISSNTSVVSVVNGILWGNAPGVATITAKTANGKIATCYVTVKQSKQMVNINSFNASDYFSLSVTESPTSYSTAYRFNVKVMPRAGVTIESLVTLSVRVTVTVQYKRNNSYYTSTDTSYGTTSTMLSNYSPSGTSSLSVFSSVPYDATIVSAYYSAEIYFASGSISIKK